MIDHHINLYSTTNNKHYRTNTFLNLQLVRHSPCELQLWPLTTHVALWPIVFIWMVAFIAHSLNVIVNVGVCWHNMWQPHRWGIPAYFLKTKPAHIPHMLLQPPLIGAGLKPGRNCLPCCRTWRANVAAACPAWVHDRRGRVTAPRHGREQVLISISTCSRGLPQDSPTSVIPRIPRVLCSVNTLTRYFVLAHTSNADY